MSPKRLDAEVSPGVHFNMDGRFNDAGGWAYVVSGSSAGTVLVNCAHTDLRGGAWSAY